MQASATAPLPAQPDGPPSPPLRADGSPHATRARWMSALASAPPDALGALDGVPAELPQGAVWLRRAETGLVMVRARTGATGAQFNLGELAVTRCALRLADGTVGMAWVRGRTPLHAERAALLDALLQQAERSGALALAWARWIAPLETAQAARRTAAQAQVQRTRVEFFTVVRGENE